MKILGLRVSAGLPVLDMLCSHYDNKTHENHIEIARRYWHTEPTRWDAIVLIVTDQQLNVYTTNDFRV